MYVPFLLRGWVGGWVGKESNALSLQEWYTIRRSSPTHPPTHFLQSQSVLTSYRTFVATALKGVKNMADPVKLATTMNEYSDAVAPQTLQVTSTHPPQPTHPPFSSSPLSPSKTHPPTHPLHRPMARTVLCREETHPPTHPPTHPIQADGTHRALTGEERRMAGLVERLQVGGWVVGLGWRWGVCLAWPVFRCSFSFLTYPPTHPPTHPPTSLPFVQQTGRGRGRAARRLGREAVERE